MAINATAVITTFKSQQPRWQSIRSIFEAIRETLPESTAKQALIHGFNELDELYTALVTGTTPPYAVRILLGESGVVARYAAHARTLTRRRGMTAETAALEHIRSEAKAMHTEMFPGL